MDSLSSLEADFNDILSGYGDAIQPLSPAVEEPVSRYSPYRGFTSQQMDSPLESSPMTTAGEPAPAPPVGTSQPSQRSGASRFFHMRSNTDSSRPAASHKRTGSLSYFSSSDPSSTSKPVRTPISPSKSGDPTLSPTKWRKEFMANSVLKPASNSGGVHPAR
jgi:hypothetical protein